MSNYFRSFSIPSDSIVKDAIDYGDNFRAKLSFFENNEYYPIGLFPNGLNIDFSPLTILYGNNGSGKSTILNLIAEKMNIGRRAKINSSPFFHFLQSFANFLFIQILMMMIKNAILFPAMMFFSTVSKSVT